MVSRPSIALKISFETLKRDWLQAALFVLVLGFIAVSGTFACGIGYLATAPIAFLSIAAQYRRVFAPGAKLRTTLVEDPWAEAVGQPMSERREPKMPGAAWILFVIGLLFPLVLVATFLILGFAFFRAITTQPNPPQIQGGAMPDFGDFQPGQIPPGFPKMELKPGQLPPGFPKMEPGQLPPGFPNPEEMLKAQQKLQAGANAPDDGGTPPPDAAPKKGAMQPPPAGNQELAGVIADLKSPDPRSRNRALAALTRLNPNPDFQDQIAKGVRQQFVSLDPVTRATAARALGNWGRPEDTPALIGLLNDPQSSVVRAALDALGHHKDPEALDPMLAKASENSLRGNIVSALRVWGPGVEPELLKRLTDQNHDVRFIICQALRDVGTSDSLFPLRNALRDPDPQVVDQARRAIQAIESRAGVPTKKRTIMRKR